MEVPGHHQEQLSIANLACAFDKITIVFVRPGPPFDPLSAPFLCATYELKIAMTGKCTKANPAFERTDVRNHEACLVFPSVEIPALWRQDQFNQLEFFNSGIS